MDGETIVDIEAHGVEDWLWELARELKDKTFVPRVRRQVLIPKRWKGKFRPLGRPCLRNRVTQTSAMMVLSPIFDADLSEEQYAYRVGQKCE